MFLFFKGFQTEKVLILPLYSMRRSINCENLSQSQLYMKTDGSFKHYIAPMKDSITSQKMIFVVFRSFFLSRFKKNINHRYFNFLCLNFPASKCSQAVLIFYQFPSRCSYKKVFLQKRVKDCLLISNLILNEFKQIN